MGDEPRTLPFRLPDVEIRATMVVVTAAEKAAAAAAKSERPEPKECAE
jgi:hypothetical protein